MFIRVPVAPMTLSKEEQSRILEVVAREGSRRDLALLTLALGTGLRVGELVRLTVGDVATKAGGVMWKVVLPKAITKGRRGGVAFLSERVRAALADYLTSKRIAGERTGKTAPLFRSSQGRQLGIRGA